MRNEGRHVGVRYARIDSGWIGFFMASDPVHRRRPAGNRQWSRVARGRVRLGCYWHPCFTPWLLLDYFATSRRRYSSSTTAVCNRFRDSALSIRLQLRWRQFGLDLGAAHFECHYYAFAKDLDWSSNKVSLVTWSTSLWWGSNTHVEKMSILGWIVFLSSSSGKYCLNSLLEKDLWILEKWKFDALSLFY